MKIETLDITALKPYANNAKTHPQKQVDLLAKNIMRFGFTTPVLIDDKNEVIAGHGRLLALQQLGEHTVPCVRMSGLSKAEVKALRLADNKIAEMGEWDMELASLELGELDLELQELTGFELDKVEKYNDINNGPLSSRFIAPPFSVLDTKQGYWHDRRSQWLELGIQSEVGRKEGLIGGGESGVMLSEINGGTSVFDPVLCEIAYSWFNVPNGTVLDPFAGGSVRGVVASKLGHQYIGCELRGEQVMANRTQAVTICEDDKQPVWVEGDSAVTLDTIDATADLIFSCPPYADLEVYSDDPADLSNMPYEEFLRVYRNIIVKACSKLADNRFVVWVVGEVRAKDGTYYNFVPDTIQAFEDAGVRYYNELILLNAIGTLPLRAARQFQSARKVGKAHQNVLVFYKGNTKRIKDFFPPIAVQEELSTE